MRYEDQVSAVVGYYNLDMIDEAIDELNHIGRQKQRRPEALALRVALFIRKQSWRRALQYANRLCHVLPNHPSPYLDAAFCLHEMKKTREAKEKLESGPTSLKNTSSYYYNMACYEAQLGNLQHSKHYLEEAIKKNAHFHNLYKQDPDLCPLKNAFGKTIF